MVSPNPEHLQHTPIESSDSLNHRAGYPCIADRRSLLPTDMIWFERPVAIREPQWFELRDEFE